MNAAAPALADFAFELFVAGDAPNSAQALSNLRSLCQQFIPHRFTIEVVDVFREPARAMAEGVYMTPTLLRKAPLPGRRIVGTLSQAEKVIHALGLAGTSA